MDRPQPHMSEEPMLGDRLRRLRQERGLSQQDLSTEGVSASYISFIEAGKRQPSERTLTHLADRLGTTVEYLRDGTENQERDFRLALRYAQLALENGDAEHAVSAFRSLLDSGDELLADEVCWGLARALEAKGDLERAAAAYADLYEDALAAPAEQPVLRAAVALSRCSRELGDLARAVDVGENTIAIAARWKLDATDAFVDLLCTTAFAYQERGDFVRSKELLTRVRRLAEDLGDPRSRGAAYWNASVLAGELGSTADALHLAERALALFGEGDDERNLARLRSTYATLLVRHDPSRAAEAGTMLRQAMKTLGRLGTSTDVAYAETELSRTLTLTGDYDAAVETAVTALDRLGDGPRLESARSRLALAYALDAAGRHADAVAEYTSAATAMERLGAKHQAALAWAELSSSLTAAQEVQAALGAARRALEQAAVNVPYPHRMGGLSQSADRHPNAEASRR